MPSLTATLARILIRRFAVAASLVAVAGAGAGGAVAVAHATRSAPASPDRLTATAAGPSPTASPKARGKRGLGHPVLAGVIRATAHETGTPAATVRFDLRSGKTIDQIAGSRASAVENDVLTGLKTRADKAVAKGKITTDQETALLAKARTRVETLMSTPLTKRASQSQSST